VVGYWRQCGRRCSLRRALTFRSGRSIPDLAETRSDASLATMSRIETIEKEVAALSGEELASFRAWFAEFDAASWDQQIADDARLGKLDALADEALRDFKSGKCSDL